MSGRSAGRGPLLLALLLLAAAACTSGEEASPPATAVQPVTTAVTPNPAPAPLPANTDGVTATEDTIYVGVLADLSGSRSNEVADVLDAQIAFWRQLNEEGGVAGRQVELLIADTGGDVATHAEKYAQLRNKVVMFVHSTGSQHTLAIAPDLVADDRLVVPVTRYSGWSDPTVGAYLLETGSNYCMEAINAVSWTAAEYQAVEGRQPRLGIATFAGDYGGDSAAGARYAAAQLGLQIAYDGAGVLVPGEDPHDAAADIGRSRADVVWVAADPLTLNALVGGAVQHGYDGVWSAAMPSFNGRLLDGPLGDYLSESLYVSALITPYGADAEDMAEVMAVLAAAYPDRSPTEWLVEGYLEFHVARTVLENAAQSGDLTPAGVVAAFRQMDWTSYGGLAPPNLHNGDAASVARATAIFRPDKDLFDRQGGLEATLGSGAVSPLRLVQPFTATDPALSYDFQGPCYLLES